MSQLFSILTFFSSSPKRRISPTSNDSLESGIPCRTYSDPTSHNSSLRALRLRGSSRLSPKSPSPTNLNRTPSPSPSGSANQYQATNPVVRKLSNVKVSTPPSLEPVSDSCEGIEQQNIGANQPRPRPSFKLGGGDISTSPEIRMQRRPRRITITNAENIGNEVKKQPDTSGSFGNLYNFNIELAHKLGFSDISAIIKDSSTRQTVAKQTDIRKSKSSPALISKAVRNIPVQSQTADSNKNFAMLIKQLANEDLQKNILATLPSPCFKLVNSPPSPRVYSATGEATPPPGVFQSASPASWQEVLEFRKRQDSTGASCKRELYRTPSSGSSGKGEAMSARDSFPLRLKSSASPSYGSPGDKFAERNSFYGSPLDNTISIELNKDLSLEPIPPHSPPDFFEDVLLPDEHSKALKEIEFLLTLSETLLSITSDASLSTHVSDLISDLKSRQPSLIPSNEAFRYSKLLMISEALRVASYALKFAQTHQKRGILTLTATLKKGLLMCFC